MTAAVDMMAARFGLNRKELGRFFKFAVVGVIGAVVDFGSLNIMLGFDISLRIAQTISFLLAILSNFVWNRYWTYPDSRSKQLGKQFAQFFLVNVSGLLIRFPIVFFGEQPSEELFIGLEWFSESVATRLGDNFIVAVAVGIVMFWNFFVNRYYTYNDVD